MATFLDVTVLENFSVIFVFLLAWIGGYAMLIYTKILGGNPKPNSSTFIPFLLAKIKCPSSWTKIRIPKETIKIITVNIL